MTDVSRYIFYVPIEYIQGWFFFLYQNRRFWYIGLIQMQVRDIKVEHATSATVLK